MRFPVCRIRLSMAMAATVLALGAVSAVADDETDEVELKIQAPVEAVSCTSTPPTITVLGLTIDVGAAAAGDDGMDESGDTSGSGGGASDDDDDGGGGGGCAALTVGQTVEVKLASDAVPLAASEFGGGGGGGDVKLKAPVQAVDAAGQTITVLGLVIDVSQATVDGADDEDSEGDNGGEDGAGAASTAIDLSQIMVGQFVEAKLDASRLPTLVASEVEVKNFANGVEVEVEDENGEDMSDGADDLDVTVTEKVVVQNAAGAKPSRLRKTVQFQRTAQGSFVLNGLPTGKAKIEVTSSTGAHGRRGVKVRGNQTRVVRVRLHSN